MVVVAVVCSRTFENNGRQKCLHRLLCYLWSLHPCRSCDSSVAFEPRAYQDISAERCVRGVAGGRVESPCVLSPSTSLHVGTKCSARRHEVGVGRPTVPYGARGPRSVLVSASFRFSLPHHPAHHTRWFARYPIKGSALRMR